MKNDIERKFCKVKIGDTARMNIFTDGSGEIEITYSFDDLEDCAFALNRIVETDEEEQIGNEQLLRILKSLGESELGRRLFHLSFHSSGTICIRETALYPHEKSYKYPNTVYRSLDKLEEELCGT